MKSSHFLVTGAGGFVGRALSTELVRRGYDVVRVVRNMAQTDQLPGSVIEIGEINAQTDWKRALEYIDIVVHLAARVHVMRETDADLMMRFLERERVPSKYVPEVWIKMRLGGQTNRNIRNIVRQNIEILQALRRHGLLVSPVKFAAAKVVSRLWQRWERPDEV